MPSGFSYSSSALAATPKSRNAPVLWSPSHDNKSLYPFPDEAQQDEVFTVCTVNYRNLDDDARATIKYPYPEPERRVVFIGEPEMVKEEHAIVEGLMDDSQSPYPMCSTPTCSTTLSPTTGKPSREDISPPRYSYPGHTQIQDQPYTHTASQSAGPELKPSSLAPHGTMGPPRAGAMDNRRLTPPATAIAPARLSRTSSEPVKPKPKPERFSRPLIALELAGYKPECGSSSPLLADQATAQRLCRGIKQHMSDQRKSHTGVNMNGQLDCARATQRQQTRTCVKLAALNAEAAQDFRAAEQALRISPGKGKEGGRELVRSKPMFDNSAWQTSPTGHAQRRSPLLTGYQPHVVVETVQRRQGQGQGRKISGSSIESVCGSSPRSDMQIQIPKPKPKPKQPLLMSRTTAPLGNGGASSSKLEGYYARPRCSNVAGLITSS
jgi:hypothetical protein